MSDDEFDNIPDEFADVQGIDWAALLSLNSPPATGSGTANGTYTPPTAILQPAQHDQRRDRGRDSPFPQSDSRSSVYFSDSGNNMDSGFLAELDRVEQQILLGLRPPAAPSALAAQTLVGDSVAESTLLPTRLPIVEDFRTSPHIQNMTTTQIASRNGKAKATELQDILSAYEDELICPICCDLLVAAHVGNPCGHTFCGECGWHWHVEKKNKGCPCCRQTLDKSMPMIPNIAMDNTVEKHVKALAISGATEWESEGRRCTDRTSRKKLWQQGATTREKKRRRSSPIPDPFQDSDLELIPRPIRRARRRPQAAGAIFELL